MLTLSLVVEGLYLPDLLAVASFYPEWAAIEGGSLPLILAAELTGCLPAEVWLGAIGVGVVEMGLGLSEVLAARWPSLLGEVIAFVEKIAARVSVGGKDTVTKPELA